LLKSETRKRGHAEEPDIIAAEIVEDLEAALQQFAAIAND